MANKLCTKNIYLEMLTFQLTISTEISTAPVAGGDGR